MGLELINVLRKQNGLKSEELSELSGVPLGTLNKILNGQSKNPTYETVALLAKALGCTVDTFAETKTPPTGEPEGGEFQEYVDLIRKLPMEQRIGVKDYLKFLVYEYEAAGATKQIRSVIA
jgi:transcriptional regulator with XRE-family HTH domain